MLASSIATSLALVAVFASCRRLQRVHGPRDELEHSLIAAVISWTLAGLVATGLACASVFSPTSLAVALCIVATVLTGWSYRRSGDRAYAARGRLPRARWYVALVLFGLALRLPPMATPLAGRDQGTYTLRAQVMLRTGGMLDDDRVLARAGREQGTRAGPGDILGLYPRDDRPYRRDAYEAGYRPGVYLADRDAGRRVPQFFHLHPAQLAVAGAMFGPSRVHWAMPLEAALALLAFAALARRVFAGSAWGSLATAWMAVSPLVIWTHRTPLAETWTQGLWWAAALAFMRARDESGGEGDARWGGAMLAALAWIRGNAIIVALPLALMFALRPPNRSGAVRVWLVGTLFGWVLHVYTVYPYVHDELLRQLPMHLPWGPHHLAGLGFAAVALGMAIDAGLEPWRREDHRWLPGLHRLPRAAVVVGALALLAYLYLRATSPERPFSRLDPLLPSFGIPTLIAAAAGTVLFGWRWRPVRSDAMLVGLAWVPVVTLAWYVPRNLPNAGLYYYGRYLVPELAGTIVLAAVYALREGVGWARARWHPRAVLAGIVVTVAGMSWSHAGVLVRASQTRLTEFDSAALAIDALVARLPADAILIAGGEGWHHGHTFNQIGGALALGHGFDVLPYRDRETAFALLHELLIAGPEDRGRAPRPVFLLVNEVSKPHGWAKGVVRTGVDDSLPPPFEALSIGLFELQVHRLTPVTDALPEEVTRAGLRLALIEVEVDGEARERQARWHRDRGRFDPHGRLPQFDLASGRQCLSREGLRLRWAEGSRHPGRMVVLGTGGRHRSTARWAIELDGRRVPIDGVGLRFRPRDSVGPFVVPVGTRELRIVGRVDGSGPCRYGELIEMRWIEPEIAQLANDEAMPGWQLSVAPEWDLGFPVPRLRWVSARALSRYRPDVRPPPRVEGRSLVLDGGETLVFPAISLPGSRLDAVVHSSSIAAAEGSKIDLLANGRVVASVDLPEPQRRIWQSPRLRLELGDMRGPVEFSLRLRASPEESVAIRDLSLYAREGEP